MDGWMDILRLGSHQTKMVLKIERVSEASKKCSKQGYPVWKCVSWREVRNEGWGIGGVLLPSRYQCLVPCVRVKEGQMRGEERGGGTCRGGQPRARPHLVMARSRSVDEPPQHEPGWKGLGRAAVTVSSSLDLCSDWRKYSRTKAKRSGGKRAALSTLLLMLHPHNIDIKRICFVKTGLNDCGCLQGQGPKSANWLFIYFLYGASLHTATGW